MKQKYELNQIKQLQDVIELVIQSSDAMGIPCRQVYFTVADIERHLGITRYYAKKLVKALLATNVLYQEKLRYCLCVESPLMLMMIKASK